MHADPSGPSVASAARIATDTTSFDPYREASSFGRRLVVLRCHHPKPRQPQYPGTISTRSHRSSPVVCQHIKREHHPLLDGQVGSFSGVQAASRPPTNSGPRRRPGIPSGSCTSTEENRMMRSNIVTLAILFAIFVAPLRGEVIESTATGFLVRHTAAINAPPAKVYAAITDGVG